MRLTEIYQHKLPTEDPPFDADFIRRVAKDQDIDLSHESTIWYYNTLKRTWKNTACRLKTSVRNITTHLKAISEVKHPIKSTGYKTVDIFTK
jgi:hypothetical protein